MADDNMIIFLHIPKTGGTTLNEIFKRQYEEKERFEIAVHDTQSLMKTVAKYNRFKDQQRQAIKAISGHQHFGFHRYAEKPCSYVTMLRDPVDRVISLYYFVQRSSYPVHEKFVGMSLKEFVSSGVDTNTQTLLLSGDGPDLDKAKHHLEAFFPVVGIMEMFDESLFLMKQRFGWSDIHYEKRNVTKKRPKKTQIPEEVLNIIRENNRLDMQLYQFVKQLLMKQLQDLPPEKSLALSQFNKKQNS